MASKKTTVGRFSAEYINGKMEIEGPAEYMETRFSEFKKDLETGGSAVVRMAPIGTNPTTLLLVAIQTDYAGWLSMKEMANYSKR